MRSLALRREMARGVRSVPGRAAAAWHLVVRSDVALGYAGVVLGMFAYMEVARGSAAQTLVAQASTNLENLQAHPLRVLTWSAFVVSGPAEMLLLPVLVVAYAVAQYHFGRAAVVVTVIIGHLLATLCVAVMLVTGIFHGVLQPTLRYATDVGFSYGLACVSGLLVVAVPRGRWRVLYGAALFVVWSWAILLGPPLLRLTSPTFTDVGHTLAVLTGLALSTLPGSRSGREQNPDGGRDPGRVAIASGRGKQMLADAIGSAWRRPHAERLDPSGELLRGRRAPGRVCADRRADDGAGRGVQAG